MTSLLRNWQQSQAIKRPSISTVASTGHCHQGKERKESQALRCNNHERHNIREYMEDLPEFRQHCRRIEVQYSQVDWLKRHLAPMAEAVCQIDYSENWSSKYHNEITSVYYDKSQVTIHPMVVMFKNHEGETQVKTYIGVTKVGSHSIVTTFCFIKKMISLLVKMIPSMAAIHFVSESPNNQYRNRTVVHLIGKFPALCNGIQATWCWLEGGHGKGPCDGVGGSRVSSSR